MKKILFILLMAICYVNINAQIQESTIIPAETKKGKTKDTGSNSPLDKGFTASTDIGLTYNIKNENFSAGYNIDAGYTIVKGLYIGVGPSISIAFSDGEKAYSVGGYGKIRYTVPLKSKAKPFIDGRGGYSYSIETGAGAPICMAGLGTQIGNSFCIGIYCSMGFSNYTYTTTEEYQSGTERVYIPGTFGNSGYYITYAKYSTRTVEKEEKYFIYAPTVTFGWIF